MHSINLRRKSFAFLLVLLGAASSVRCAAEQEFFPIEAFAKENKATKTYHISQEAVDKRTTAIANDFKKRSYYAKATYAMGAAGALWLAYQMGFFSWISDKIESPVSSAEARKIDPQVLHNRLLVLEQANTLKGNFLVRAVQFVGWNGLSILGTLIVHTQWQSFFDYALARPSFEWFFANHTLLASVDSLKHTVEVCVKMHDNPDYMVEYHQQAFEPAMELISKRLEEFIGFSTFYLESLPAEFVERLNMHTMPLYLIKLSNDFFAKLEATLLDGKTAHEAPALVAKFRTEIAQIITRSRVFEKEYLESE